MWFIQALQSFHPWGQIELNWIMLDDFEKILLWPRGIKSEWVEPLKNLLFSNHLKVNKPFNLCPYQPVLLPSHKKGEGGLNPSTPQVLKTLCVRTSLLTSNKPLDTQGHFPHPGMCIPRILLIFTTPRHVGFLLIIGIYHTLTIDHATKSHSTRPSRLPFQSNVYGRREDSKVLHMSVPLIHPTYTLDPYRFVVESSQVTTWLD